MENSHLMNTMLFLERMAKSKSQRFDIAVRPIYWLMLEEMEDRIKHLKIDNVEIVHNMFVRRRG